MDVIVLVTLAFVTPRHLVAGLYFASDGLAMPVMTLIPRDHVCVTAPGVTIIACPSVSVTTGCDTSCLLRLVALKYCTYTCNYQDTSNGRHNA